MDFNFFSTFLDFCEGTLLTLFLDIKLKIRVYNKKYLFIIKNSCL